MKKRMDEGRQFQIKETFVKRERKKKNRHSFFFFSLSFTGVSRLFLPPQAFRYLKIYDDDDFLLTGKKKEKKKV